MMDSPDIRQGDTEAFDKFALQIRALVGMLETLGDKSEAEIKKLDRVVLVYPAPFGQP